MLFHVDPHSGVLNPGDELPSIRSVSVPPGVNPMTISTAYNLLVGEEVLVLKNAHRGYGAVGYASTWLKIYSK